MSENEVRVPFTLKTQIDNDEIKTVKNIQHVLTLVLLNDEKKSVKIQNYGKINREQVVFLLQTAAEQFGMYIVAIAVDQKWEPEESKKQKWHKTEDKGAEMIA